MSSVEKQNNTLIGSSDMLCLELFKEKVDELSGIASRIPEKYKYDAREYFFEHCDSLRAVLGIKQQYNTLYKASRLNADTILPNNASQTFLEKKDRKISGDEQENTLEAYVQNKDVVSLDIDTEKSKSSGQKVVKSGHVSKDEERKSNATVNDLTESSDNIKVNTVSNKKTPVYSDSHLEIFYESTHRELKQITEKCADDEMVTWSESFDEAEDERIDNAATNGDTENQFTDVSANKIRESGQDTACDIAELIKCIPQLSQYMEIDPKNVTVLKDDDDEDEKCLHISVELSDGTVQKFKVAGYVPSMSEQAEYSASSKDGEMEVINTKHESKEQTSMMAREVDTVKDPSILGSRLRTRKLKAAVARRGPGRPKNDNIPAPETNEKGEAFYRCEECKATVKTYNALIVHMRTHTGSRPFHCSFCNKSFTTKGNMRAHEVTTHSDSKPWKCEYCDKCFKEKKVMKIHERIHTGERPYSCSICEKAFTQRSVMVEHMLTHSNNRPHLCDYCGQGFRGLSSLKAHKKRHIGLREFQCDSCEKAFVCKNELKRHLLTHTGDRPYSCEICSKAFTRLSYLKEHVNLHTGAKPFLCTECGLAFSDTMSLHRHKKKHKVENESKIQENGNEPATLINANCDNIATADVEQSLTLEIPEHMTINGEQTSIQVVVDENTSMEDFQKLHSLLLSATGSAELMMNSQDTSKHLYQVLCVNPDTQEVVGQVEGQEVIVEGQSEDITSVNLQYNIQ